MNQALGEVDSEIIKVARKSYIKVYCIVIDEKSDCKSDLFYDCRVLSMAFDKCGFGDLNNLAELCNTVFITQQQASVIKELKELTEKFKELK